MDLEKKLNIALATSDIAHLMSEDDLDTSIQGHPERSRYRAIIDAIKKLLSMEASDLFQFANEGGSIEEGVALIDGLVPQTILEQEIKRTVQSGNYAKVLEIRMQGEGFAYKGFIVVPLSNPNDRIAQVIKTRMKDWKPGQPVPFQWYKTEAEALKALETAEQRAASQSPAPAQPARQKVTKVAAKMAEYMGSDSAAEIVKMSPENIIKIADLGMKNKTAEDHWGVVKTVFLAWLALGALVTGVAGLAALIIGYFAVKGIALLKSQPPSKPNV